MDSVVSIESFEKLPINGEYGVLYIMKHPPFTRWFWTGTAYDSYVRASSVASMIASAMALDTSRMPANPGGNVSQYVRGDGSLAAFPAFPSLAAVATSGSYADLGDKPTIPAAAPALSQGAASRTLDTAFQIHASRNALVTYSVQLTVTASIAGGQNGDVVLEIANEAGFTTGVQTLAIAGLGQTYSLAIALNGVQPQTGVLCGVVPAGKFARLRTVRNTGVPAFLFRAGQEVLL